MIGVKQEKSLQDISIRYSAPRSGADPRATPGIEINTLFNKGTPGKCTARGMCAVITILPFDQLELVPDTPCLIANFSSLHYFDICYSELAHLKEETNETKPGFKLEGSRVIRKLCTKGKPGVPRGCPRKKKEFWVLQKSILLGETLGDTCKYCKVQVGNMTRKEAG